MGKRFFEVPVTDRLIENLVRDGRLKPYQRTDWVATQRALQQLLNDILANKDGLLDRITASMKRKLP
jgi:hypothetical protein